MCITSLFDTNTNNLALSVKSDNLLFPKLSKYTCSLLMMRQVDWNILFYYFVLTGSNKAVFNSSKC